MGKTATPTAPPALVVATVPFYSFHLGANQPVRVEQGAIARAEHTIVASNPTVWAPLVLDFDTTTETEDR